MCEILIRARDKTNADPYMDAKCLKRGDVVSVVENNWSWGTAELTAPYWRIVKLPKVSVSAAESLLAPEFDADPQNPSPVLRRRAFKWDLDSGTWSTPVRNWINNDTRATPFRTVNISEAQFLALKVTKNLLPNPEEL